MPDSPTGEAELVKLGGELKNATDEVKRLAEKFDAEGKNLGKVSDETKAKADEALTGMNTIKERISEIERKIVRRVGGGEPIEVKSTGQTFVESDEWKSAMGQGMGWRGQVKREVKTITSASASGASATTALVPADRQPGVIMLPDRPRTVRSLLMPGRTSSGAIEYVKEKVVTMNAASVAENPAAPKPQSDITYEQASTTVKTIAHWIPVSKQIMDDAPQLQSMIDYRLRMGLDLEVDRQLLVGDGTGTNLFGLIPQATPFAMPTGLVVKNATMIDVLRAAMLQATLALYPATGHVLHPTDWASIELTKDAQNRYIFANVLGLAGPTLWGLPVSISFAITQGQFLTGALMYAAQVFDREDASVLMSTEDRDNFVKNMVTLLAELRLALAVYRQKALITGSLTPPT